MKFTLQVGDKLVELPSAESRDKALVRAGLNPVHWKEKGVKGMVVKTKKENTSSEASTQLAFETVIKVDIGSIRHNPYQPEGRISPPQDVVERIAASIKEHGLLQTPVVRQRPDGAYEMGDGWIRQCGYQRLLQTTKDEQWKYIPVVIRNLTDKQMADLVMEANTVRNDLSPIDLAKFYQRYLEDFGITQTELARIHNVSQGEIANTLRLLDLPEGIQKQVISHDITETHARYLLQVKDPKEQKRLANDVANGNVTVARLDQDIKSKLWQGTRPLAKVDRFEGYELKFDPECCDGCEHKLSLKYPYGGSKEEAHLRCDNGDCWAKKNNAVQQASHKKEIDELKAQGITNILGSRPEFYTTLDGWKFQQLDDPAECKMCPKRAAVPNYQGKYEISCVDEKCFKDKSAEKTKADKHAQEAEAEKTAKYIEDVFTDLPINEKSLQTTIECLLNGIDDTEPVLKFVKAFNLFEIRKDEDLEDQDDINGGIMTAIREKSPDILTLQRMIARLSFEGFIDENRYGMVDKDSRDKILKSFKAAHQGKATPAAAAQVVDIPKYTLKKIGSDYIAVNDEGLIIATGMDKQQATIRAGEYFKPIATKLNPDYGDYLLNHTYRISFATNKNLDGDVTAQDASTAVAALGGDVDDIEQVKVWKCSGKPSTGGGVGCGWGKCTETLEKSGDDEFCGEDGDD